MSSKNTIGLGGTWRGALLAVATPGMLLAFVAGCDKTKSQDISAVDAEAVSAADVDGGEVAPPPAVVSGDPDIPLNEAVVGTTPVPPDYAADTAPPPPVVEEQPATPDPADVWVPGYWWWSVPFHRYVWVSGAWRNPPPEQFWTPGEWVSAAADRYVWMPGFWGTRGSPRPAAIELAPPLPRVEVYGPAPGVGFFWTPGYYAFRDGAYFWNDGLWARPPREGLGWIEPRYVGIGGHYYFQPGRWDFAPEHRGTVYLPDINVHAGMHFSPVACAPALVISHARFVTASSHAIAIGATRTATGGYAVHGGASISLQGGAGAHGGPAGNEHGGAAGNEHGAPAGNEHGAPAGNEHGAPAGNEHGAPAGNEHGAPAGNEHGAPAGNEHGAPAGNEHGAPAGNAPHGGSAPQSTEPHGGAASHGGGAPQGGSEHGGGAQHGAAGGSHGEHPQGSSTGKKPGGKP